MKAWKAPTIWARFLNAMEMPVHSCLPSENLSTYSVASQPDALSESIMGSYLSYAVDVLKEITSPSSVPSTVNI